MIKRKIFIICCFLLALFQAGCGKSGEEKSDTGLVLGFSQIGSESAWRIGNTKDIEEQAETYGIGLMFENANQKQDNQIAAIRRFIAYKVDVIAFSPVVEEGWDNVLLEAKEAGIPIILVDRDINTEQKGLTTCLIGADFYREGVMAAEYLIRKADKLGLTQVNIVEITGTENSTPMRQRQAGFMDTIAGDERMKILESIDGDFLKSRGAECMRTGQWVMHWPQRAHLESSSRYTSRTSTVVLAPVLITSQTLEAWILSQTWMQRMHFMHLE